MVYSPFDKNLDIMSIEHPQYEKIARIKLVKIHVLAHIKLSFELSVEPVILLSTLQKAIG